MLETSYSFSDFNFSFQIIRDLVFQKEKVKPFINDFFTVENIYKQIKQKTFTPQQRQVLVAELKHQNSNINLSEKSKTNIVSLVSENTYTITTGHQLNLLSGPLYTIYKILQVIIWTEKLKETYNQLNFIPVFWMASEDHDFDEINHINLFNNKIEWKKNGQDDFVTGAIETDLSFIQTFSQPIIDLFDDETTKKSVSKFLNNYKNTSLARATRQLLNDLFGKYGLVIIDGNSVSLKKLFQPVIEKELTQKLTFNAVYKTNTNLKKSGYHNQVFLRECNLFYIKGKTVRHRIIRAEEGFKINNEFKTTHQLIEESKQYPERFSPNALLRPIYQELVLPNIAYIGGGGEIAYWLQIKGVFKQLNLTMPLLRVRDSYILLNSNQISKLKTLNLSIIDLKQNYDDLAKFYIRNNTTCDLSLRSEKEILTQLKTSILNKIDSNEIGLHRFVEAEMVKTNHQLEKIEKKLLQNEKKKQAQALNQIKKLKDKVYPDNGFQERQENFLQYIHIPNFIDYLKKELDLLTNDQAQIHLLKIKFYHANNGKFAIN